MKTQLTTTLLAVSALTLVGAQPENKPMKPKTEPGPRVVQGVAPAEMQPFFDYTQQSIIPRTSLVTPEQAQATIERFKTAYTNINMPRILIYVNRDLVDQESGYKLSSRTEKILTERKSKSEKFEAQEGQANAPVAPGATYSAQGNVVINGNVSGNTSDRNRIPGTYTSGEVNEKSITNNSFSNKPVPAFNLTDRQTVRDVERLFGRPLRYGGATLVDQRVATQLIPSGSLQNLALPVEGEQARKDREALTRIADVVLEILISSRTVTVQEVSGPKQVTVPDIQATAIRLNDSMILGQATSADVLGTDRDAGKVAKLFGVQEISEATALALMEDMTNTAGVR